MPSTAGLARRPAMTSDPAVIAEAADALLSEPRLSAGSASTELPPKPGLYAVFAESEAHEQLGLPSTTVGRPIYLGKAEKSLLNRDGQTHFKLGQTGRSTLRRSLAALLHDALQLRGQPRQLDTPATSTSSPSHPITTRPCRSGSAST